MRNHYVSEISHQKGYIDSPPSFFVAPPCSYFHEASEFYCSVSFAAAASNVPFNVVCNFHRVKHDPILQKYFHRFSLPCRSDNSLTEAVSYQRLLELMFKVSKFRTISTSSAASRRASWQTYLAGAEKAYYQGGRESRRHTHNLRQRDQLRNNEREGKGSTMGSDGSER